MDQAVIAGIGNIYSDEILFDAKVHPSKIISNLSEKEKRAIYSAIKKILSLGVKLRGESFSDYRRTLGQKGFYDKARKVYRRTGEKCPSCDGIIERIKIGGRSAHFCPKCQRI
jgi:formamidopyrimidine-DNA glycosylase